MRHLTTFICLTLALKSGDYATALREWKPLAEQGNADAQSNLSWMYGNGNGVVQDNIRAHMWRNIDASQGDKDTTKNRDKVAKNNDHIAT